MSTSKNAFSPVPALNLALLGYGKMGRAVEAVAKTRGHKVYTSGPFPDNVVFIDFSKGISVKENVEKAGQKGASIVIGTTDWEKDFKDVETLVKKYDIGMIFGSNFSSGILALTRLLARAKELLPDWSLGAYEIHHEEKKDSPSGTAKRLSQILGKDGSFFAPVRVGQAFGTHTVIFDNAGETITISHTAKSRESFAFGALLAAEWIAGKKGVHRFEDVFDSNA